MQTTLTNPCLQGFFWLAPRPHLAWQWSTAGSSRRFVPYGHFLDTQPGNVQSAAACAALHEVAAEPSEGAAAVNKHVELEKADVEVHRLEPLHGRASPVSCQGSGQDDPHNGSSGRPKGSAPPGQCLQSRLQRIVFIGVNTDKVRSPHAVCISVCLSQ